MLSKSRKEVSRLEALVGKDKKKISKVKMQNVASKIKPRVNIVKKARATKKYSLKHPNLKHMSARQIKYWSSKKRARKIFRSENPMKKTRVMQRIFALKEREASTLRKMNELNTRIGMKSSGVRAGMVRAGKTAIVNGELIKAKANFHLKHTFQGQSTRNPRTDVLTRDPKQDRRQKMTMAGLQKKMAGVMAQGRKEANSARFTVGNVGKPVAQQQGALKLKTLKKAVKANGNHEDMGEGDDQDDERVAEDVKEDEEQDDALMDNEEDGQMDDDSDVDMAEDSMGLDDGIDADRD